MPLPRPNLDIKGRVLRGAGALALGGGAFLTWSHWRTGSIVLAASAGFMAFEAARGWCALRACGLKTKF